MAARARRSIHRSGHEKAFAALLEGPTCGDKGSASSPGFHHYRGVGKAANQPIASWESPPRGRGFGRQLRHDGTTGSHDRIGETLVRLREEPGVAAPQYLSLIH